MRNDTDTDEPVTPLLLDLFQAYYDARKNKRGTINALRFELDFESRIFELYEDIVSRRYGISRSTCFIVKKPVQREIFAGDFRDRIVHHLLYNYLSPLCERLFIFDTYGCRTRKGTSCGIRHADHFIRSCSRNYTEDCFVLKLDIRGYFMSINRAVLYEKVSSIVERFRGEASFDAELVLWLLRMVIFHDHTKHCRIKGKRSDWVGLPFSKSLFHAAPGCGLPIGNLTSQLFGNIYLNDFDHFAAGSLPDVRYGRYVDDMLFVHRDKEAVKSLIPKVREYLWRNLALTLHPKKIYLQHYSKGVDFLGASIRPYRIYPRHRLKGNMRKAIMLWNRIIVRQGGMFAERQVRELVALINSYLGHLVFFRTRTLRRTMIRRLSPIIWRYATYGSPWRKISRRRFPRTNVTTSYDAGR